MKLQRYVLTGLRKDRQSAHSPVLLNWHIADPDISHELQRSYPRYEHFNIFRITEGVFKRLQKQGFSWEYKIENFSVHSFMGANRLKRNVILCTEAEYWFSLACELIVVRGVAALHGMSLNMRHSLGQPQP